MMVDTKGFHVPAKLNATIPAEKRGTTRDRVRLMVMNGTGSITHDSFLQLSSYLKEGDLLVMNNSRTLPAALKGMHGNREVEIRLSRRISEKEWDVLVVDSSFKVGDTIDFKDGISATISDFGSEEPLVRLLFSVGGVRLTNMIYKYGEPIRYEYIDQPWSLDTYQTVYAAAPGSVEMTSAGRAITWRLLNQLKSKGINLAFLQLHAGLSYYGNDHWPTPSKHPEKYVISEETANLVNDTHRKGGRVIAVGTTVVRALESATDLSGRVSAKEGVTDLYIQSGYHLKVVDGLLTGFHEPEASHLDLLTAFVNYDVLMSCYQEAIAYEYLWHEFGDMNLILPEVRLQ
ncbi:S-adenosylmethionine:tRNA ribosyltransferase-isomerase [Fredinandcohnia humi]